MLFSAVLVGASRVLAEPTSGSLERALPPYLVTAWYILLTFGSVVALVGVFWRDGITGLLIERAGLFSLSAACLVYGLSISMTGGFRGLAAATFVFGFSAAALTRAIDVGRIIRFVRALALVEQAVLDEGGESRE